MDDVPPSMSAGHGLPCPTADKQEKTRRDAGATKTGCPVQLRATRRQACLAGVACYAPTKFQTHQTQGAATLRGNHSGRGKAPTKAKADPSLISRARLAVDAGAPFLTRKSRGLVPFLRQGKRDDNQNLVKQREGVGGGFGEVEDAGGEDAEIQSAGGGDDQRHDERGSDGRRRVVR